MQYANAVQKRLVKVNDHRLATRIAGQGAPIVVLENHFGGSMNSWRRVWRDIARFTTVVRYDRAGLGDSERGPTPRTAIRVADDLRRLLTNAGLPPPYVLVGHSFGGLFIQGFARRYPRLVAGLVIVDSSHEDGERQMWHTVSKANRERALQFRRENSEHVDIGRSLAQIRALRRLPNIPIMVLHAPVPIGTIIGPTRDDKWTAEQERLSQGISRELALRSKMGKLIIVRRSSHFIQLDRPDVVIAAIRNVVISTRRR